MIISFCCQNLRWHKKHFFSIEQLRSIILLLSLSFFFFSLIWLRFSSFDASDYQPWHETRQKANLTDVIYNILSFSFFFLEKKCTIPGEYLIILFINVSIKLISPRWIRFYCVQLRIIVTCLNGCFFYIIDLHSTSAPIYLKWNTRCQCVTDREYS
jgi:hypothetical protein